MEINHSNRDTNHQPQQQPQFTKLVKFLQRVLEELGAYLPRGQQREDLLYLLRVTLVLLAIASAMLSLYEQAVHGRGAVSPSEVLELLKQLS